MDLITQAINTIPTDLTIKILLTMPGPSVLAVCSVNKEINQFCKKYSDRIFMNLVYRDFERYLNQRGTDSWKTFYMKKLALLGQPYMLRINITPNFCQTNISDTGMILSDFWNKGQLKHVKFNVGPFIKGVFRERKAVLSDYDRGKKYWILFGISNVRNNYSATVHDSFESAYKKAQVYFTPIKYKISLEPENVFFQNNVDLRNLSHSLFNIFKNEGYICYQPKADVINKIIIKEITLE